MTINDEDFFLIFWVALVFFLFGNATGCSLGEMSSGGEFKKGQHSCKVCEVKNGKEIKM